MPSVTPDPLWMRSAGGGGQRHSSILAAAVAALILLALLAAGLALLYLRQQAEQRVMVASQNLAKSLVLTFEGMLDAIDVALLASKDEISQQLSSGHVRVQDLAPFLELQQKRLPVVPYIRATNEHGDIMYDVGGHRPHISAADREYFTQLRDAPPKGLMLSKPLYGRISKKWMWLFARRVVKADGTFGGVVYTGLDIGQLNGILAQFKLDAGGSIELRYPGMDLIAGRFGTGAPLPAEVGSREVTPALRVMLLDGSPHGMLADTRDDRTFFYEHSHKYGFNVIVGESDQVAMTEWRRQAWAVAMLATAFVLLALVFLRLLRRAWRRQQQDIAALRDSQLALREAHEIADIGSLTMTAGGGCWTSSATLDRILGIDVTYPRDLEHLLALLESRSRAGVQAYLTLPPQQCQPFEREHVVTRRCDGQPRWVLVKGRVRQTADAGQLSLICTIQDITKRKLAENEIRKLAYYDVLTGLPNRRLLLDRLQQVLNLCAQGEQHGALLLIDLDNFKSLNDTRGHGVGDLLLQAVATRLLDCVGERGTVARLGGDEFVVMLGGLGGELASAHAQAEAVGERILGTLSGVFDLSEMPYHSTPSIGVTLFGGTPCQIGELLQRADTAMYQAKAAGRNTMRFFDPAMRDAAAARIALEADLRDGLGKGQFLLHYQAQVDVAGQVIGAEALARWCHPVRGLVAPAEFIPIAEDSGLILPLGRWVLEQACAQLVTWAKQPCMSELSLAINVSARQFNEPDFVAQVFGVIDASGARPERLKLELTEGVLLENTADVIAKMRALKARGICFALDDFGTGYSSLSYLKQLPLDQLKIDRSFVHDLLCDANDAAIVRTVIALGHTLGMEVMAEGVETETQLQWLASAGCSRFQGYYFSRPLSVAQFEVYLKR